MEVKEPTLRSLIERSENNEFVLPNFQRDFIWKSEKQKTLISSFIVNLPTGNFLSLEGKKDDFAARAVCYNNDIEPANNCVFLLDGQQRFSTLKNTFFDLYDEENPGNWRQVWDSLFKDLKYRTYLSVGPKNGVDYFGLSNLKFEKEIFFKLEPSMLEPLIEQKAIYSKDAQKYFHPGYNPKKDKKTFCSTAERRLKIADKLSEDFLIPLYDISNNKGNKLIKLVFSKIASKRLEEIQAEVDGDETKTIEILSSVDDSIKDYIESKDEEKIRDTWSSLKAAWIKETTDFSLGLVDNTLVEMKLQSKEIGRAFAIFEVINQPGTPLDEYDLVVAKSARNRGLKQLTYRLVEDVRLGFDLPKSITSTIIGVKPSRFNPVLIGSIEDSSLASDLKSRFLQMLSVISHCGLDESKCKISIDHLKRNKILELNEKQINDNFEQAITCVLRAYSFLHFRCGIVSIEKIPYKLMLLPIAFCLADDKIWNNKKAIDKIEYWYWTSLFGGYYRMDQNQQSKEDMITLKGHIKKNNQLIEKRYEKILDVEDYSDKEVLLRNNSEVDINSNIHNAILQYIISKQPIDFLEKGNVIRLNTWDIVSNKKFMYKGEERELSIEDHHICPLNGSKSIYESTKELRSDKKHILNSPLNRTYISKTSNRELGTHEPLHYLSFISDSARFGHCLPLPVDTVYTRNPNETEQDFYRRVLDRRFEELKTELQKELISLKI
jgi:hypothetical protein